MKDKESGARTIKKRNCKYNLQWLCEPCNLSKNDKTMEEYLIYREDVLKCQNGWNGNI